jgi:hypothetical protein
LGIRHNLFFRGIKTDAGKKCHENTKPRNDRNCDLMQLFCRRRFFGGVIK